MKCANFLVHYLTALNITIQQRNMDICGVHSSLEWTAVSLLSKQITKRLDSIIRNAMVSVCKLLIHQCLTTTVHTIPHDRNETNSKTLVFTLHVAALICNGTFNLKLLHFYMKSPPHNAWCSKPESCVVCRARTTP
jgi:hypothetical protein